VGDGVLVRDSMGEQVEDCVLTDAQSVRSNIQRSKVAEDMGDVASQIAQQVISSRFTHHALSLMGVIEWEVGRTGDHWIASSCQSCVLGSNGSDSDVVDDEDIIAGTQGSDVADDVGSVAASNRVDIVGSGRTWRAMSSIVDWSRRGARIDRCGVQACNGG
jgi:hypothetical protein